MTRRRKIGLAAVALAALVVVLGKPEVKPPFSVRFLYYASNNAVMEITNHAGYNIGLGAGLICPHESFKFAVPVSLATTVAQVQLQLNPRGNGALDRVRNYLSEVGDYDLERRVVWTNVTVPLPLRAP